MNPKKPIKKKRVIDLAQKLGLSTTTLLSILNELGFDVKSPMTPLTKEMEIAVREKIEVTKKESKESLERKKKIWGEEKVEKVKEQKKRTDRESVQERVKETLAQMTRKPPKPRRKKVIKEKVEVEEVKRQKITIPGALSLGELAKMLGVEPAEVVKKAMDHGILATINQTLDVETIMILADEFGYDVEIHEEKVMERVEEEIEFTEPRPPVVTVMGHVDHGKTTLLDYLRKTQVAEKEFGGITQHIGAYQIEYQNSKITFIDTPGHEAFTSLRVRGAQVTDIVILVVAANEGVKPQTLEAISHARAAKVPIIVAINKIDLPSADPEKVRRELSETGLISEEWGGDTIIVDISAKTGEGINDLLDAVLIKAEELDLKSTSKGFARGVVLESKLEKGRGPVATVLVQEGTLKMGNALVVGTAAGKVRAMYDEWGRRVEKAGPSTPVLVQGLDELSKAGDHFYVVETEREAREIAKRNRELKKEQIGRGETAIALRRIQEKIQTGELKELPIVVKGDCQGSVEAIDDMLSQMVYEEVKAEVIHRGIGNVTESDVLLASASEGIIIAFNVGVEPSAKNVAKQEGVFIKTYKVIYELLDDVKKMLAGLLEPEIKEIILGKAEVREVFKIPKVGIVAGCYVLDGTVERDARARVRRDGEVIFDGKIASLKRFKEDVKEVQAGYECGLKLEGFEKIKVGDLIEIYRLEKFKKELE